MQSRSFGEKGDKIRTLFQPILQGTAVVARLSFAWWQDKPQWENDDWLAPHLAADMSFEDYRDNVDPALEAALAYDGELSYLDPMDRLTELFEAGKMEQVKTEARKFVEDPHFRYYPFEERFGSVGYNLLGQG
ncbi:hypothetical protein [Lewinella sp. IMCC34183]|uniref:hypothetical protein n=1 Tax=Lewinella sp. IMCC34183 TaxID=2248762 RepID=UPI001E598394|nr:hypothetical protein [Lewinella sp. IMCC34183]